MAELVLCEPTELYNILNQVSKLSRLAEPNYLCLLDVRNKREYDESHVITARRVKQKGSEYLIPESVDLECVKYCVVYDSNTSSLEVFFEEKDDEKSDKDRQVPVLGTAIEYARVLSRFTRHPVYILRGGYECFSALYHFFRTQKIIWMPQELDAFQPYPVEITPGKIYLGNFSQACNPKIQKDLKIKAHVNVSMEAGPFFIGDSDKLLHIQVEDTLDANITPFFRHLCHFIEVLDLPQEVQKQHASESGLCEAAAALGEDCHWRHCHRHLGSTLLTFSKASDGSQRPSPGGLLGSGCVTRLALKEKAFAA
ncbi:serine/threonine/tyrosine-interacting-like protein 1 isoform X2 [Dasypus novemcinctus]|uniref:serine/threonine/tyrosine-interacting-like protein 1 isoform X2 n=1 Tax=Dasypus novemcinctus TaxID=9361 RepID=UPI0003CBF00F|nr:serine/threonine/tyrosine-interacting-like protein 1 isoform X2 [Dasypus novemcinctus]